MPFEYVTSWPLVISVALVMGAFISIAFLSNRGSLNGFKARQVGDGQHGTARWATKKEISKEYLAVPFLPQLWRKGKKRPKKQGLVVGSITSHLPSRPKTTALVDAGDVHCLMIGASGVGKTAYYLYPNLEYACASGISFLTTDTKGDVYRNYGTIAKKYYGYDVSVIDLRNLPEVTVQICST